MPNPYMTPSAKKVDLYAASDAQNKAQRAFGPPDPKISQPVDMKQGVEAQARAASPWTQRQYRLTPQFFDRCHYRIPVRITVEQWLLSDATQDYNPPRVIREHGFDLRRFGAGTIFEPIGTLTSQALRLKSVNRI